MGLVLVVAVSGTADNFHPGQRWISETEPELGLGSVRRVTPLTVTVGVHGQRRDAGIRPRQRAAPAGCAFAWVTPSRTSQTLDNDRAISCRAELGLIFYQLPNGQELCETELSDAISFNKPQERLLAGQLDPTEVFRPARRRVGTSASPPQIPGCADFVGGPD